MQGVTGDMCYLWSGRVPDQTPLHHVLIKAHYGCYGSAQPPVPATSQNNNLGTSGDPNNTWPIFTRLNISGGIFGGGFNEDISAGGDCIHIGPS